jgi:hypothetical protein
MPEYSRQGAGGPRFVPADDGRDQTGRPPMQSVPGPAAPSRAGRPAVSRRPAGPQGPEVARGPEVAHGSGAVRGATGARGPEAFRPRPPRRPGPGDLRAGDRRAADAGAGAGAGAGAHGLRLTGRGAVLGLFVLSFLGILASGWLGTGIVADALFVAGCAAMAWYAKPSDLLTVAVSPPLAFFFSCVLAKLISSSGGTSAAEGILVTLATSAPWLFAGTALTIAIGLRRGLRGNLRELRQGLRGNPGAKAARADERAPRP